MRVVQVGCRWREGIATHACHLKVLTPGVGMMTGLVPTPHAPCCNCTPFGRPLMHMKPGSKATGPGPSESLRVSFATNVRAFAHG